MTSSDDVYIISSSSDDEDDIGGTSGSRPKVTSLGAEQASVSKPPDVSNEITKSISDPLSSQQKRTLGDMARSAFSRVGVKLKLRPSQASSVETITPAVNQAESTDDMYNLDGSDFNSSLTSVVPSKGKPKANEVPQRKKQNNIDSDATTDEDYAPKQFCLGVQSRSSSSGVPTKRQANANVGSQSRRLNRFDSDATTDEEFLSTPNHLGAHSKNRFSSSANPSKGKTNANFVPKSLRLNHFNSDATTDEEFHSTPKHVGAGSKDRFSASAIQPKGKTNANVGSQSRRFNSDATTDEETHSTPKRVGALSKSFKQAHFHIENFSSDEEFQITQNYSNEKASCKQKKISDIFRTKHHKEKIDGNGSSDNSESDFFELSQTKKTYQRKSSSTIGKRKAKAKSTMKEKNTSTKSVYSISSSTVSSENDSPTLFSELDEADKSLVMLDKTPSPVVPSRKSRLSLSSSCKSLAEPSSTTTTTTKTDEQSHKRQLTAVTRRDENMSQAHVCLSKLKIPSDMETESYTMRIGTHSEVQNKLPEPNDSDYFEVCTNNSIVASWNRKRRVSQPVVSSDSDESQHFSGKRKRTFRQNLISSASKKAKLFPKNASESTSGPSTSLPLSRALEKSAPIGSRSLRILETFSEDEDDEGENMMNTSLNKLLSSNSEEEYDKSESDSEIIPLSRKPSQKKPVQLETSDSFSEMFENEFDKDIVIGDGAPNKNKVFGEADESDLQSVDPALKINKTVASNLPKKAGLCDQLQRQESGGFSCVKNPDKLNCDDDIVLDKELCQSLLNDDWDVNEVQFEVINKKEFDQIKKVKTEKPSHTGSSIGCQLLKKSAEPLNAAERKSDDIEGASRPISNNPRHQPLDGVTNEKSSKLFSVSDAKKTKSLTSVSTCMCYSQVEDDVLVVSDEEDDDDDDTFFGPLTQAVVKIESEDEEEEENWDDWTQEIIDQACDINLKLDEVDDAQRLFSDEGDMDVLKATEHFETTQRFDDVDAKTLEESVSKEPMNDEDDGRKSPRSQDLCSFQQEDVIKPTEIQGPSSPVHIFQKDTEIFNLDEILPDLRELSKHGNDGGESSESSEPLRMPTVRLKESTNTHRNQYESPAHDPVDDIADMEWEEDFDDPVQVGSDLDDIPNSQLSSYLSKKYTQSSPYVVKSSKRDHNKKTKDSGDTTEEEGIARNLFDTIPRSKKLPSSSDSDVDEKPRKVVEHKTFSTKHAKSPKKKKYGSMLISPIKRLQYGKRKTLSLSKTKASRISPPISSSGRFLTIQSSRVTSESETPTTSRLDTSKSDESADVLEVNKSTSAFYGKKKQPSSSDLVKKRQEQQISTLMSNDWRNVVPKAKKYDGGCLGLSQAINNAKVNLKQRNKIAKKAVKDQQKAPAVLTKAKPDTTAQSSQEEDLRTRAKMKKRVAHEKQPKPPEKVPSKPAKQRTEKIKGLKEHIRQLDREVSEHRQRRLSQDKSREPSEERDHLGNTSKKDSRELGKDEQVPKERDKNHQDQKSKKESKEHRKDDSKSKRTGTESSREKLPDTGKDERKERKSKDKKKDHKSHDKESSKVHEKHQESKAKETSEESRNKHESKSKDKRKDEDKSSRNKVKSKLSNESNRKQSDAVINMIKELSKSEQRKNQRVESPVDDIIKSKQPGKATERREDSTSKKPVVAPQSKPPAFAGAKSRQPAPKNTAAPSGDIYDILDLKSPKAVLSDPSRLEQVPGSAPPPITRNKAVIPGQGEWCVDGLIRKILAWSPNWFAEYDAVKTTPPIIPKDSLLPLLETYDSYGDYIQIMTPHFLLESWYQIYNGWKESQRMNNSKVNSVMAVNLEFKETPIIKQGRVFMDLSCQGVLPRYSANRGDHVMEGDLVKATLTCKDPANQQVVKVVMGHVTRIVKLRRNNNNIHKVIVDKLRDEPQDCMVIHLEIRLLYKKIRIDERIFFKVETFDSLVHDLRQYSALMYLPKSPLCRNILNPCDRTVFTGTPAPEDAQLAAKFNPSQARAISTITSGVLAPPGTPRMYLLQGPPGTGKSHVITGLIHRILYKGSRQSPSPRLLLCAPSNAAVDELTRRLMYHNGQNQDASTRVSLVRFGKEKAVHRDVLGCTLNALFEKNWSKYHTKNRSELSSVKNAMEQLQNKLNGLHAAREKIAKTGNTTELKRLEFEIQKQEKRKTAICGLSDRRQLSMKEEHDIKRSILLAAQVVCCTLNTAGSAQLQGYMCRHPGEAPFTGVIIDEAGQCIELDALIPLQFNCSKVVLVGDPEQLPPTVISKEAADMNYGQSLLERYYSFFKMRPDNPFLMLTTQYRMHRHVCRFPNEHVYYGRLDTDPGTDQERSTQYPLKHYGVFDISFGREEQHDQGAIFNMSEAVFIVHLCDYLLRSHHQLRPERIGIITPYKKQKMVLIKELQRYLSRVEVGTVDGFQGREKDVIIVSCVRAGNTAGKIGFLADRRRMNVALTRAKYACYVACHTSTLKPDPDWGSLVKDAAQRNVIVNLRTTDDARNAFRWLHKDQAGPPQGHGHQGRTVQGSVCQGEPTKASVNQGEPSKGSVHARESFKGSVNQREPSKGSVNQGEPSKGSVNQREPSKGSVNQREPSKGSVNQREPLKGSVNQREPSKGSVNQREPLKGSVNQGEPSKGRVNQGEPSKGSVRHGESSKGSATRKATSKRSATSGVPSKTGRK